MRWRILLRLFQLIMALQVSRQQAKIADTTVIHPSATIMPQVVIGAGTVIEAGAVLHAGVTVGENCHIRSNSVLSHCLIGNGVDIGAGSVIGAAGFGFEMTDDGVVKLPHIGLVVIDDFVSIGSGCAIDRGSLGNTHIGAHVMMDNLCHIAHNVTIGARSIIAGQCGISGSVTVGRGVAMGGQVGIAPHVKIGDGAVLTARSGVTKDIEDGDQVAGFPAIVKTPVLARTGSIKTAWHAKRLQIIISSEVNQDLYYVWINEDRKRTG
jgi:UDP-3-O-[3-hydroxymyristoyl] glucosamine N-acyltransferase